MPDDTPPSIAFYEVFWVEMLQCAEGAVLKLWTKPDMDLIYAYRPGSIGGTGKVGTLLKSANPVIARCIAAGQTTWIEITKIEGKAFTFTARSEGESRDPLAS